MNNNHKAFLALVRAGLWEKEVHLTQFGNIDFNEVYRLAEKQSVVGLVAAGIEHVTDVKVPQEVSLIFAGTTLQLEQQNKAMNVFLANLMTKMRLNGIDSLLVKGQGVAQCYERPFWRACGDVDLLLCGNNYINGQKLLVPLASKVEVENGYNLHLAMTIDSWPVELHGSLRGGLWKKAEQVLDELQHAMFCESKVRSWVNGQTQVFLPDADVDAVYVFYHILQHYFYEGVGLRQICDWCRLLWMYKDTINDNLLESRIRKMEMMSEWKAFSAFAVGTLGMPEEAMPFYSSENKWKKKANKILSFVLETGNFGHNRDYRYQKEYSYVLMKAISFWKHIIDFGCYLVVFPVDSMRVTWRKIIVGLAFVAKGK